MEMEVRKSIQSSEFQYDARFELAFAALLVENSVPRELNALTDAV
jgi:hypothetical protein